MSARRAAWAAGTWQRTSDVLRGRVVPFVRQPKFWVACVTAIGVQVVLALVVPRSEEAPLEHIRTAANPWRKPAPVPAERIVVPPAQGPHDTVEPDSGKHGTTTPLGATGPSESLPEAAGAADAVVTEADGTDQQRQTPRMAENRRLTADGRQFDGVPADGTDGATLADIVPLEPMHEPNHEEPQQ